MIKVNAMRLAGLGYCACVFACVAFAQDTQPGDVEKRATLAVEKAQAAEEKADAALGMAERGADDRYAVLKDVEGFFDRALNRVLATIGIILGGLGIGVALLLLWLDKQRNELFQLRTDEFMTAVSAAKDAAKEAQEQSQKGVAEALQRIDRAQEGALKGVCYTAAVLWLEFAKTAEQSARWLTAWCNYCHGANGFAISASVDWLLKPLARLVAYCEDGPRMAAEIRPHEEAKIRLEEVLHYVSAIPREAIAPDQAPKLRGFVEKLARARATW